MIDELFRIGDFAISPFGPMLALALAAAGWQLARGMRRRGVGNEEDALELVVAAGLIGIVGGKIYYALLVGDWRMFFDRAGIVWYGGLIAGVAAFFWMMRRRKLPFAPTLDAGAPALALGYAIGRIGCLLVGDDYGIPTDRPWGIAFAKGLPPTTAGNLRHHFGVDVPTSIPDSELLAVHPTQLYTTLASLAIFGFALWLERRVRLRPGGLTLVVFGLMAIERFGVEFLRAKDDRFFGHFTLAQLISVVIFLIVVALAWRQGLRERPETA